MILLIDNYDSFAYNLYQLIGSIDPDIRVIRNDTMTVDEIASQSPRALVLSPGPGRPEDAGVCVDAVRMLGGKIPIFGVCLGCQAICVAHGGVVSYAKRLMHGKRSDAEVDTSSIIFAGLPHTVQVARYHSLAAVESSLPECLRVTARSDDGEVMALEHVEHPTYGVQFHPESIMTSDGRRMVENFLAAAQ